MAGGVGGRSSGIMWLGRACGRAPGRFHFTMAGWTVIGRVRLAVAGLSPTQPLPQNEVAGDLKLEKVSASAGEKFIPQFNRYIGY